MNGIARDPASLRSPTTRLWIARRWAVFALAAVFVGAAAILLYKTHGLTFYYDEWAFVLRRHPLSTDALLQPHNEHLVLLPVLVYKVLFAVFGLRDYAPFVSAVIAINLLCGGLMFVYVRRRLGDVCALAAASALVLLGPAWEAITWPFEISLLGPLAAGLGMLLALERHDLKGDLLASALLLGALASSAVAIPVFLTAAVEVALGTDRWRRMARVLLAPGLLYGLWYLLYGRSQLVASNLLEAPRFMWDSSAAAMTALTGTTPAYGPPLVLGLVFLVAWRLTRARPVHPRLWTALAFAGAFFGLTGLGRVGLAGPADSRYLYPGAVVLLVVMAETGRGLTLGRRAAMGIALLVAVVVVSNLGTLRQSDRMQEFTNFVAPKLRMLELARGTVDPAFRPDMVRAPDINAAGYFAAVDRWGSPADSDREVLGRPEAAREESDVVLAQALRVGVAPAPQLGPRGEAPTVEAATGGTAVARGHCVAFAATTMGATLDLTVPASGLLLRATTGSDMNVRLRRFATGYFGAPLATLRAGQAGLLRIPPDSASRPWHLRLATMKRATACGVA